MKLPDHISNPDPQLLMSDSYVVIDVETTNLEKGNACIVENQLVLTCVKFSDEDKVKYLWGSEFNLGPLVDKIMQYDLIVAHNSKMELKWLQRAGMDLTKVVPYCTMIGEYVLSGNRRAPLGLGHVAQRYNLGGKDAYVDMIMRRGTCPSDMPKSLLLDRCVKDVYQTEGIFLEQREKLRKMGLLACAYTRNIFTPVLADIEMQGMQLDADLIYELHREATLQRDKVLAELRTIIGEVNTNSPKQMAVLLYEDLKFKQARDHRGRVITTPSGNPATSSDIVAKLDARTKKQKQFKELWAELARLEADLTKALDKFKLCCDEAGGLLFANFNQTVTKTTRLSSTGVRFNVQFQNLARKYKKVFKARREGWPVGEIDGAQIEFRVAGYLGQDSQVYDDLINEADIHKFTASEINSIPEEEVTKDLRTDAKADTFKPLYGGKSGTEGQMRYYKAFREKYQGVTSAQEEWMRTVLRTKKLVMPTGFIFYWPDTRMMEDGFITNSTNICNYPVQYLATGEIVPIGVTILWHKMKALGMQSFLVNTVHDSAIAELCPGEEEQFRTLGQAAMTSDTYEYMEKVYGIRFNLPLGTGCEWGEHWSEGEEVKYQLRPPYPAPTDHKHQAVGGSESPDF
jgi:DNA polymerase I